MKKIFNSRIAVLSKREIVRLGNYDQLVEKLEAANERARIAMKQPRDEPEKQSLEEWFKNDDLQAAFRATKKAHTGI